MKKYSWFTFKEKDEHGRYIGSVVYGEGGLAPFMKCYDNFKPCRKGGHRHNHIYNACHRIVFRGKASRRLSDWSDKREFVEIFYTNLRLHPGYLSETLQRKWRKR